MLSRRELMIGASAACFAPGVAWADDKERLNPRSVAVGDVGTDRATLWARGRREGPMVVQVATNPEFRDAREWVGPVASEETDFTARLEVTELPRNERLFWRASFGADGDHPAWMTGSFRTAGGERDVRFAFGGDTCGQGFGIDDDFGGMRIFEAIRQQKPDFLVHAGDLIYADIPIKREADMRGFPGRWRNLVTPEVEKVSETLAELRGRYRYNHIDDHFRTMLTEVPVLHMWDDHEVKNNWYPAMKFRDSRYRARSVAELLPQARRAFFDYTPIPGGSIYRKVAYGPLLDVFLLDTRSFRGPNSRGRHAWYGPWAQWLGPFQRDWLKRELRASRAHWKVVVCDMPLGISTREEGKISDNATNGRGVPLGRELEIADILRYVQQAGVHDIVWLTADLHYATATHYGPTEGVYKDFDPFWEFMAGPLHAGTGTLHGLDPTFGARTEWASIDKDLPRHAPPSEGHQFFGMVEIDGHSRDLRVKFYDQRGSELYTQLVRPYGA